MTLFHASEENSEPTCATAMIVSMPTIAIGPPTPTCTGCSECHPALRQKFDAEVGGDGLCVAADE